LSRSQRQPVKLHSRQSTKRTRHHHVLSCIFGGRDVVQIHERQVFETSLPHFLPQRIGCDNQIMIETSSSGMVRGWDPAVGHFSSPFCGDSATPGCPGVSSSPQTGLVRRGRSQ
jgi:hypothetical protein